MEEEESSTATLRDRYLDFNVGPWVDRNIGQRLWSNPRWTNRKRLVITALVIGGILTVLGILIVTGVLSATYEWFWMTFIGRPLTHIMRDNPWLFVVGAGLVIVLLYWFIPRDATGRIWIIFGVFAAGFVGGHVFW